MRSCCTASHLAATIGVSRALILAATESQIQRFSKSNASLLLHNSDAQQHLTEDLRAPHCYDSTPDQYTPTHSRKNGCHGCSRIFGRHRTGCGCRTSTARRLHTPQCYIYDCVQRSARHWRKHSSVLKGAETTRPLLIIRQMMRITWRQVLCDTD